MASNLSLHWLKRWTKAITKARIQNQTRGAGVGAGADEPKICWSWYDIQKLHCTLYNRYADNLSLLTHARHRFTSQVVFRVWQRKSRPYVKEETPLLLYFTKWGKNETLGENYFFWTSKRNKNQRPWFHKNQRRWCQIIFNFSFILGIGDG